MTCSRSLTSEVVELGFEPLQSVSRIQMINHWLIPNPLHFEWLCVGIPSSKMWDSVILAGTLLHFSLCLSLGNPTDFRRKVICFIGEAREEPGRACELSLPAPGLLQGHFLFQDLYPWGLNVADSHKIVWTFSRAGWQLFKCVRQSHSNVASVEQVCCEPASELEEYKQLCCECWVVSTAWTPFCRAVWPWALS